MWWDPWFKTFRIKTSPAKVHETGNSHSPFNRDTIVETIFYSHLVICACYHELILFILLYCCTYNRCVHFWRRGSHTRQSELVALVMGHIDGKSLSSHKGIFLYIHNILKHHISWMHSLLYILFPKPGHILRIYSVL